MINKMSNPFHIPSQASHHNEIIILRPNDFIVKLKKLRVGASLTNLLSINLE